MPIEFTMSKEIEAPPERVFEVMTDIPGAHTWMPNLIGMEMLTEGDFRVGSKWRETRKMFGKEASEVFEVTRLDPGRRFDVYVDGSLGSSRSGEYRFRHDVVAVSGGTRVTLSGEIGGMSKLMELVGRLFAGPMKKAIAKDLDAMKAHIETGAAD